MWTSWWWELWSWNLFESIPKKSFRQERQQILETVGLKQRLELVLDRWDGRLAHSSVGATGKCRTLSKNMIASENLQHGWCLVGAFCNVLDCTRNTQKLVATCARVDVWCARTSCNENLKHCAYLPRSARASRGCLHDFRGLFSQVVLPKNVNPGPRDVSARHMWNHARSRDQEMRHVFPACLDAQSTVIHWYTKNHCM